ncbi:hypothetical protein D3C80_2016270 [compost metagenome]
MRCGGKGSSESVGPEDGPAADAPGVGAAVAGMYAGQAFNGINRLCGQTGIACCGYAGG